MRRSFIIAALLFLAVGEMAVGKSDFACSDGQNNQYEIILKRGFRTLKITRGKSQPERIRLSKVNFGRQAIRKASPQIYVRKTPKGKTAYTSHDLSTQVRIRYYILDGSSRVAVSIIEKNREVPDLTCKVRGVMLKVVSPGVKTPLYERIAEPITQFGDMIEKSGRLSPISILNIENSIRRLVISSVPGDSIAFGKYRDLVKATLKKAPRKSLAVIRRRLGKKEKSVWDNLLKEIKYEYYSEVKRYVDWVSSGMSRTSPEGNPNRDWNSVYAGVRSFLKSRYYRQKDMKAFFSNEVGEILSQGDQKQIYQILEGLPREKFQYMVSMIEKYAPLQMMQELAMGQKVANSLIKKLRLSTTKGANRYHGFSNSVLKFMRSPLFKKEKVKGIVGERLGLALKKVPSSEFKIIKLYFSGKELKFLNEMVGVSIRDRKPAKK